MSFKEFVRWCNERACDGCWGMLTAMACIDLIQQVRKNPFLEKREVLERKLRTAGIRRDC
jgi:hypothetical protein|nr:MAG TPA: hypothetical protein [Caudoviricetes sp.]